MSSGTEVIIFVVALILALGFLLLIITLIPAINQMKVLMEDLRKTSVETRDLALKLKVVTEKVDKDVDKVNDLLDASKETVTVVSNSVKLINKSFIAKSAGFLAFLPAIRFGWNLVKKFKGGK